MSPSGFIAVQTPIGVERLQRRETHKGRTVEFHTDCWPEWFQSSYLHHDSSISWVIFTDFHWRIWWEIWLGLQVRQPWRRWWRRLWLHSKPASLLTTHTGFAPKMLSIVSKKFAEQQNDQNFIGPVAPVCCFHNARHHYGTHNVTDRLMFPKSNERWRKQLPISCIWSALTQQTMPNILSLVCYTGISHLTS